MKPVTVRLALLAMHYQEKSPGKWAKPSGFHLFGFNEEDNSWWNIFTSGLGDDAAVYDVKEINEKTCPLAQLKAFEAYGRNDVSASAGSSYHSTAYDL